MARRSGGVGCRALHVRRVREERKARANGNPKRAPQRTSLCRSALSKGVGFGSFRVRGEMGDMEDVATALAAGTELTPLERELVRRVEAGDPFRIPEKGGEIRA